MKYFEKLKSERLYLSPINPKDVEIYTKWMNDEEVAKGIAQHQLLYDLQTEKAYLEEKSQSGYNLAIVLKEKNELIGGISLIGVDYINKTAEIAVFIGPEEKRGRGYGPEAMKLLIDYGFNTLNLQNIDLEVYSFNEIAIKVYLKLGFKEYGRRTKSKYYDGKYYDTIRMEILNKSL